MGNSLLTRIPPPREIHSHMGRLYRELAILRRLLRLSQTIQANDRQESNATNRGASHGR